MTGKPLVSILTPVYNQRPYIAQTINSVLNQIYQNWEWIILDDGSTDGTGDIIRSVKDSRIKYVYQENAGINQLTKTFNKALTMCNGDLIATLDGDDYWPGYKLEIQVKNFNDPNAVLSYGESWLINQRGKKIHYINLPDDESIACNNPLGSALKKLMEEHSCFIVNSTVMYRKSALLNIGGFIEAKDLAQDFPTWIRLSLEGTFTALPIPLGYYRKHPSSISLRNPEHSFDCDINFFKEFINRYQQKLHALGLSYDLNKLEEQWEKIKIYLHYNHALYLLIIGSFNEARVEFKKFLVKMPFLKHHLIYALITLSALIKYDLVNPSAGLKEKTVVFFRKTGKKVD